MSGWDSAAAVEYYESFCQSHSRYRTANRHLVKHAALAKGQHVLDIGAGTGRTAEEVLPAIGRTGSLVAVEPARAMRREGARRLASSQIEWRSTMPSRQRRFDRILCGAAIWQFPSLRQTLHDWAGRLKAGGALACNFPALYLQEPDKPGGGSDPWLTALPGLLMEQDTPGCAATVPLRPADVEASLRAAGLHPRRWRFRVKMTQTAFAAWLKIPLLTEGMMPGSAARERALRIDAALQQVDLCSWKWERWIGWTAWKS
ncbi:MAG: class I SAM-dependent methyltransferase [Bryobacterales bacterium]|nr:class I SAM-dependent methyltransferase [Bryobacterales bacterium]